MRLRIFVVSSILGAIAGTFTCLLLSKSLGFFNSIENSNRNPLEQFDVNTWENHANIEQLVNSAVSRTPLVRHLELSKALQDVEQSTLVHLQQTIRDDKTATSTEVQRAILESIARLDPALALNETWKLGSHRRDGLVAMIFSHWVNIDIEQSLRSAFALKGFARETALKSILANIATGSAVDVYEIAEAMGNEYELKRLQRELEITRLSSDPEHAINAVFVDEISDLDQQDLLVQLGEVWFNQEGIEMFPRFIKSVQEQLRNTDIFESDYRRAIYVLVESVTTLNPEQMWNLVMSLESISLRKQLLGPVLSGWAEVDFLEALQAAEEIDDQALSTHIYRNLLQLSAVKDPFGTLNRIQQTRQEHRSLTIAWAIQEIHRMEGPVEAIRHLSSLREKGENVSRAALLLSSNWAREDAAAALDWILETTESETKQRYDLLTEVLPAYSSIDPQKALEIAKDNSNPSWFGWDRSLEIRLLEYVLARGDLTAASHLLEGVREPVRGRAFLTMGRSLISMNKVDNAIALGDRLPTALQPDYFDEITLTWLYEVPESLVPKISRLSTENAKAIAAAALQQQQRYPLLTPSEVSVLEDIQNSD